MKVKTSELDGAQLDWAVAHCEEWEVEFEDGPLYFRGDYFHDGDPCKPSTDWGQGGPIIEREMITVGPAKHEGFMAWAWPKKDGFWGDSPLVAAMRCFVASKLGEEVEVPDGLA